MEPASGAHATIKETPVAAVDVLSAEPRPDAAGEKGFFFFLLLTKGSLLARLLNAYDMTHLCW